MRISLPNIFIVVVFAAMIAAPMGSLFLLGYSHGAEKRPGLATLDMPNMVGPDESYRTATVRDAVIGSPVGMAAISMSAAVDYFALDSVATDYVISGAQGWLFYREDFRDGTGCASAPEITRALRHIKLLEEMGAAVGIDVIFSLSPDKSAIYPEKLAGTAALVAACKPATLATTRSEAARLGLTIVDHLPPLLAERDKQQLFWATDTHWTTAAQRIVYNQWRDFFGLPEDSPFEPPPTKSETRVGDLMAMLRLSKTESMPDYTVNWPASAEIGGRTLILHDSFYGYAKPMLQRLFKRWSDLTFDRATPLLLAQPPTRIIINTVERELVRRVEQNGLRWDAPLGQWLLSYDGKQAASACSLQPTNPTTFKLYDMERVGPSLHSSGIDPQMFIPIPAGSAKPCIDISFSGGSGDISELFLPTSDGSFSDGRSITFDPPAGNNWHISLMLPASFAGTTLRFDPPRGEISGLSVSVGATGS